MLKIKKLFILPLFVLSTFDVCAQDPTCYRIYLSDKHNSPYSINQPEVFLSTRAIDKRTRFNIPITEQDFPVNPDYIQYIQQIDSNIRILSTSKWMNTVVIYCVDTLKISEVQNLPFVVDVLPVGAYKLKMGNPSYIETTDKSQNSLTTQRSESEYGAGEQQIKLHNGDVLHESGYRGEGMLIAVIDGGWYGVDSCDFFQTLVEENRFLGKFSLMPDFVDTLLHPSSEQHGTIVTSVMASNAPGVLVGTAPEAQYAFIHSEYVLTEELIEEDFWARAAEIADSIGADVINSSLGYRMFPDFPQANIEYSDLDGLNSIASRCATILAQKGVIVCVAAGNDGANDWFYISRPGDAFDILTVGACSYDSVIAPFSSRGYSADGRVKPDVCAVGMGTCCIYPGNELSFTEGTSLATPVISGLCACLWQALPQYTSLEIMQLIRENSHIYENPNPEFGYGIPDFGGIYLQLSGINNIKHHSRKIYPNPCSGYLYVDNSEIDIKEISLFDNVGKLILNTQDSQESRIHINTNSLKAGVYFGEITKTDKNKEFFKVVVQ